MKKDYNKWHELKSYIEEHGSAIFFKEREIWWCSVGLNIGYEIDGKNDYFERPVLIFRKFNREVFWALPMSTKVKEDRFHYIYSFDDKKDAAILLSQLRLISSKRLIRRLAVINENTFEKIREEVKKFF